MRGDIDLCLLREVISNAGVTRLRTSFASRPSATSRLRRRRVRRPGAGWPPAVRDHSVSVAAVIAPSQVAHAAIPGVTIGSVRISEGNGPAGTDAIFTIRLIEPCDRGAHGAMEHGSHRRLRVAG